MHPLGLSQNAFFMVKFLCTMLNEIFFSTVQFFKIFVLNNIQLITLNVRLIAISAIPKFRTFIPSKCLIHRDFVFLLTQTTKYEMFYFFFLCLR